MNGTLVKNQLIFDFASGSLGPAKSIFASTYLYLNAKASNINRTFEGMLGDTLFESKGSPVVNFNYKDCLANRDDKISTKSDFSSPISNILGPLDDINWKQVYNGLSEFSPDINDDDELKLIKMDPGSSVPLHSHGGKEYILVISGSFCDEYGKYKTGDIQINDQKIKHTPIACKNEGCVCLTITEKDVIYFGKYGSFLNLFTFIKSFFK